MLTMKKADYEKILAHAKENLPEEACGLIAGTKDGDKKIIEKVYLLENVDHTNEHFSMNPKDQLAAVKDMRANGLVPLGNWHSVANLFPFSYSGTFPSGIAVTSVRGR